MTSTANPATSYDADGFLADDFPRPPQADREAADSRRLRPSRCRRRSRTTELRVELGRDPNFATRCFGNFLLAVALISALVAANVLSPVRFDEPSESERKAADRALEEFDTSSP